MVKNDMKHSFVLLPLTIARGAILPQWKKIENCFFSEKLPPGVVWSFFLSALLIMLPGIIFNDIPLRDVAGRYAPMADAFAAGDFRFAFHPRIPLLFPLTGGVIAWLFSCSGFLACKIASALFFALGVFPFFEMMRRIYSRYTLLAAGLLYLFAAPLIRLGFSGLRDSCKGLIILLLCCSLVCIYQERRKLRYYILLGIAAGMAILTRGDLILYALIGLGIAVFFEFAQPGFAWRSAIAGGIAVIMAQPALQINYWLTGSAVPEQRFDFLAQMVLRHRPDCAESLALMTGGAAVLFAICYLLRKLSPKHLKYTAGALGVLSGGLLLVFIGREVVIDFKIATSYLGAICEGLYGYYAAFALLGVIIRIRQKKWRPEESILAAMLLIHTFGVLVQIILFDRSLYVSSRYLEPAIALECGWTACAIVFLWGWVQSYAVTRRPAVNVPKINRILTGVTLGCILISLFYAYLPLYAYWFNGRKKMLREAQITFSQTIREACRDGQADPAPAIGVNEYRANRSPAITFVTYRRGCWAQLSSPLVAVAYLAGGREDKETGSFVVVTRSASHGSSPPPSGVTLLSRVGNEKIVYELWRSSGAAGI